MSREKNRGKTATVPLRLLAEMMKGRSFTVADAEKHFGISEGTAKRHLRNLEIHVPGVEKDASSKAHVFRFRSAAEDPTDRERTTYQHTIAVAWAAAFSRVFGGSRYAHDLRDLRKTMIADLPEVKRAQFEHIGRKFVVRGGFEEELESREKTLDEIFDALLRSRRLKIEYQKFEDPRERSGTRTIELFSLAIHESHLYLVGRDVGAAPSEVRTFRFSRIRSAKALSEHFEYPTETEFNPETAFRDSLGIWGNDREPLRTKLRLAPRWTAFARHHRWHASQTIKELPNGFVEVNFRVRHCPEFERFVLGFGEEAEVLDPPELREKIAKRARAAAARYESPKS